MIMQLLLKVVLIASTLTSCVSLQEDEGPPEITNEMSTDKIFNLAIEFGGETLRKAKQVTAENGRWAELSRISRSYLLAKSRNAKTEEVHNATMMYLVATAKIDIRVLRVLTRSKRADLESMAWQMCTVRPSETTRKFLEEEASYFLSTNQETKLMTKEFAKAVTENDAKTLFSLMVRGLITVGSDDFARAMISLNSGDISNPFVDYLSRASLEDLRQMNQNSINSYTSLVILRYFLSNPLPIGHPELGHIFLYAISRNIALSDIAREVIAYQLPIHKEVFVQALARQPLKVQVAYIETVRQRPNANHRQILSELKQMTRYSEVVEEIEALKIY